MNIRYFIIIFAFLSIIGCSDTNQDNAGDNNSSITKLDLSDSNLETLSLKNYDMRTVASLDVSGNQLTTLPDGLKKCKNLYEINLSGNLFEELPEVLYEMPWLKRIVINNCKLKYIRSRIKKISELETLFACGNEISSISDEISLLPNLKYVDFSKNGLKALDYVFLPEALYVNLSSNGLARIPNGILTKKIVYINAADNAIGKIPDVITSCNSLSYLDLSDNKLWYFPEKMNEMVSLRTLDVSRNNLTWFPRQIAQIVSLEELKFDENKAEGIGDYMRALTNLRSFSIANNNLKYFPMAFLDGKMQLSFIYMNGNKLSQLPDDIADMPYLCLLDVRENPIANFSDKLKSLETKPLFQAVLGRADNKVLLF